MQIQLEWHRCAPTRRREDMIHQTIEAFAAKRRVSSAGVRVEERVSDSPRFEISMLLQIPGPDLAGAGSGQTFDEALVKLTKKLWRDVAVRERKLRRNTDAPKGVKASYRG
jgi:hypothetical protein